MEHQDLVQHLKRLKACSEAVEWVISNNRDPSRLWISCPRGTWLLWLASAVGIDKKQIVLATCACARLALKWVPRDEKRPLRAIETAEAWVVDKATIEEVRCAAYAARAAACAAAYAAADAARAAACAAFAAAYAAADAADFADFAQTARAAVYATDAAACVAKATHAARAAAYADEAARAAVYAAYAPTTYAAEAARAAFAAADVADAAYAAAYADEAERKMLRECTIQVIKYISWRDIDNALYRLQHRSGLT